MDQVPPKKSLSKPEKEKVPEDGKASQPPIKKADESEVSKKLTAEEEMALYEKNLKENDWGHQPC